MKTLPSAAKFGIVAGGYIAAVLFAFCVVSIYIDQTSGIDRDTYSGMSAFGDSLFFVAVFGAASIIPTGLALYFLQQSRKFWSACCVLAVVVAITSLLVVVANLLQSHKVALNGFLNICAMLAFPRIFLSPFLAVTFGLSAWAAPEARFRWYLLGAAGAEGFSSVYGFWHWFVPLFFQ